MTNNDCTSSLDVLLLSEDFYPKESGGAFIDWNVATHLVNSGHTVTVVTPKNEENAPSEMVKGVEIRRPFRGGMQDIHPNSPKGIFWRLLFVTFVTPYLCYLSWSREFDVIYSTNHLLHPLAALVSLLFQSVHVSFVGYSPSLKDKVSLLDPLVVLERLNFQFFMGDQVLCRTPSVKNILLRKSQADVSRINGIVDKEAVFEAISSTSTMINTDNIETEISLIYVGRLVDIKNPTRLPNLITQLPPNYSLLIIGDGPHRSGVEDAIRKANVSDRVRLAGQLPHKETLREIYDSDILLLPSKTEAYPTVVFEALSLNTSVLATPVGILSTIKHPNLTTAPLRVFSSLLLNIETSTTKGVDEETLKRFSVENFTEDVQKHLKEAAT